MTGNDPPLPRRSSGGKGPVLAFGATLFLVFVLTTISLYTPGWRYYRNGGPQIGIVTYRCGDGIREVNYEDCRDWYTARWHFERATLAFMILAFLFEILAFGIFGMLMVNPRSQLGLAAAGISFIIFACLFVSLLVYGVNFQSKPVYIRANTNEMNGNAVLGYSYWIGVSALVVSLLPLALSATLTSRPPE